MDACAQLKEVFPAGKRERWRSPRAAIRQDLDGGQSAGLRIAHRPAGN
jgi:hypothetical protein